MPDRYGDPTADDRDPNHDHDETTDHEQQASPAAEANLRAQAINTCQLCNHHGQRNGFPCDHTDHTAAAKRGMTLIRTQMGWKTPQNTTKTTPKTNPVQPLVQNPASTNQNHNSHT